MHWVERNGWVALLAFAAISVVFGLGDLQAGAPDNALAVTGMTNEQLAAHNGQAYALIEDQIRAGGIQLVLIGVLLGAILLCGFRRHQRWSWWALWSLPIFAASEALLHLVDTSAGQRAPAPVFSGSLVAVIAAAILLVSAPRFFGERQVSDTQALG